MTTAILLEEALCAQSDPETWFLEKGDKGHAAREICGRCTVRDQCLDLALTLEAEWGVSRHGIWGGTTPGERDVIARRRRAAA